MHQQLFSLHRTLAVRGDAARLLAGFLHERARWHLRNWGRA